MLFEKRKEAAIQELKESGIWKSNGMPPALIMIWKLGIKAKPPHYNAFSKNAFLLGVWFASAWGLLMWFLQLRSLGFSILGATILSLVGGILFGLTMAAYYKWSARKHRLSNWTDLPSGGTDA